MVPVTALLLKVLKNSPSYVYRMLEEGQIVGVRGLPPPRLQKAGGRHIARVRGGVQGFLPPHLLGPPWKGAGAAPFAVGASLR